MAVVSYAGVDNGQHLENEASVILCMWVHLMAQTDLLPSTSTWNSYPGKQQHFQGPFDTFLVGGDTAQVSELNSATMANLYFGQQLTTIFTGCIWR
jgi:hypothetical protein